MAQRRIILAILTAVFLLSCGSAAGQERWSLLKIPERKGKAVYVEKYRGKAQIETRQVIVVIDSAANDEATRFLSDMAVLLQDALYRKGFDCGLQYGRHGLYSPEEPDDVVIALTLQKPSYVLLNMWDNKLPLCHRIAVSQIRPARRKTLDSTVSIAFDRESDGIAGFISGFVRNLSRYTGQE